jgi:OFA family oxalate/formate antiporter-like MFS transporter
MEMSIAQSSPGQDASSYRWLQLVIGIACMVMIANLQYGWTFFVDPIGKKFGWTRTEIQYAFFLFVLAETWLVPIEAWFVDRFGPKIVVFVGGLLVGLGWVVNALADSLTLLYVGMVISGVGAGAVYGTCVGNALKWFGDRRGLAAGLTAAGFGAGSAFTVIPITNMIDSRGYADTFLYFGIGQGLVVMVLAWLLAAPDKSQMQMESRAIQQSRREFTPWQAVRAPIFWVMYAMFVLVGAGGIMITANLAPIAKDFGIDKVPIAVLAWTLTAVQVAASIDRILNGLTRPFFGWVSDRIGRENTMFIAFSLEAIGIWALSSFGHSPVAFAVLSGVVFFAWGEIYSLFPSTCTDCFGPRFAATNAGLLYTAKGTASLLTPQANKLEAYLGSWDWIFIIAVAMNALAAIMALAVLKPMRQSWIIASTSKPVATARAAE